MFTVQFHEHDPVLELVFQGRVNTGEVQLALRCFNDERFTPQHHVLIIALKSEVAFGMSDLDNISPGIASRRGFGSRTAFVMTSEFMRSVAEVSRQSQDSWPTHWKFFTAREPALIWLRDPGDQAPDFEASR